MEEAAIDKVLPAWRRTVGRRMSDLYFAGFQSNTMTFESARR